MGRQVVATFAAEVKKHEDFVFRGGQHDFCKERVEKLKKRKSQKERLKTLNKKRPKLILKG